MKTILLIFNNFNPPITPITPISQISKSLIPNPDKPEPKIFATKAQRHEGFFFVILS